jgi:MmeI, DNA-methyltransferase domain/MmeI, target recognition domain
MDSTERHAYGAHFTSEADIQRIVGPTIVRPWQELIDGASSMKDLLEVRRRLMGFRVLDPACGSGNFLYVSYRELARLDLRLLLRLKDMVSRQEFQKQVKVVNVVSPRQFHGIDLDSFGVELAKVTLMLAKKLALDEVTEALEHAQGELGLNGEDALPLDNLDENIRCADALFTPWPTVDAIIGNPPYQSKNKATREFGRAYVDRVRSAFPGVPGRADYCVYWFRKAHDHLQPGQRAGLVGTNTIRQTYSRQGGLDYIVNTGGTITEAVSSQVWSGDAVVHVSIVDWVKGPQKGKKRLVRQLGDQRDSPWEVRELDVINSALSYEIDLKDAKPLQINAKSDACFQGQTHGNDGFLLPTHQGQLLVAQQPFNREVLFPFLITDDLIGTVTGRPTRYVIDFGRRSLLEAQKHKTLYTRVERQVLPDRGKSAKREQEDNEKAIKETPTVKIAKDHANALKKWWLLFRAREQMVDSITVIPRYIVCGRVTKRPIFCFVDPKIHPNDSLAVFPLSDDYSFGVLQSSTHWLWFTGRCSTLKADWRYTSNTVFDSFPWPQAPVLKNVAAVAQRAVALRKERETLIKRHNLTLRELYRTLELPGDHPLKDAHTELDKAVREAYGMAKDEDALAFLLKLNLALAQAEAKGESVRGARVANVR